MPTPLISQGFLANSQIVKTLFYIGLCIYVFYARRRQPPSRADLIRRDYFDYFGYFLQIQQLRRFSLAK